MPVYVTNPLDRAVTLHAADGETVQVPPKTRDAKVHRKFTFMVPAGMRLRDPGEVARHERDHVRESEPELAASLGLSDGDAAAPAPADAPAPSAPSPRAQDAKAAPVRTGGEGGSSSSGAPPPAA